MENINHITFHTIKTISKGKRKLRKFNLVEFLELKGFVCVCMCVCVCVCVHVCVHVNGQILMAASHFTENMLVFVFVLFC